MMGVNFPQAKTKATPKFTEIAFCRLMRLKGEFNKAQLEGLYARYLADKSPDYVTSAMNQHYEPSESEILRAQQLMRKNARRQAILGVLQIAQRNLSVDEIVKFVGLDTTHRQVVVDARKLVKDELIIMGIGGDGKRYYRVVGVSA